MDLPVKINGEVQTAEGSLILIRNETGALIGVLSGQPRTGVERVLDALGQWKCPNHADNSCIALSMVPDHVLVVAPASLKDAIVKVLTR